MDKMYLFMRTIRPSWKIPLLCAHSSLIEIFESLKSTRFLIITMGGRVCRRGWQYCDKMFSLFNWKIQMRLNSKKAFSGRRLFRCCLPPLSHDWVLIIIEENNFSLLLLPLIATFYWISFPSCAHKWICTEEMALERAAECSSGTIARALLIMFSHFNSF